MTLSRRLAIYSLITLSGLLTFATGARADWRDQVPVFRIGILGGALGAQQLADYACWGRIVEDALGVPVQLSTSPDYGGVIQGLLFGELDAAELGAASYALIHLRDPEAVEPLVATTETDGTIGYHSVLFVRADSPYQSLDDLRGRSIVFTDPNSTSGYLVPNYELTQMGYAPARFFGRMSFSGSHPAAVDAVLQGAYDAGVTWTSGVGDAARGYSRGNLRRMVDKGRLRMRDIRILWQSGLIPEGPHVVRKALPDELKQIYARLLLTLPQRDPNCFRRMEGGRAMGYKPVTQAYYETIIEIRRQLRG